MVTFCWGIIATAAFIKWCDDSQKTILDLWGACAFIAKKVRGGE